MSLIASMERALDKKQADGALAGGQEQESLDPGCSSAKATYVSTNLEITYSEVTGQPEQTLHTGGKTFPLLTPQFYGWLYGRLMIAKKKLSEDAYSAPRDKFLAVHRVAIDLYGKDALKAAIEEMRESASNVQWSEVQKSNTSLSQYGAGGTWLVSSARRSVPRPFH